MRLILTAVVCSLAVSASAEQLPFSPAPDGVQTTERWASTQGEDTITPRDVAAGIATGKDLVVRWLVSQKVCAASAKECPVLVNFEHLDENPADNASRITVRFRLRGPTGAEVEGYVWRPNSDMASTRLWRRHGAAWRELSGDERVEEIGFTGNFMQLVAGLAAIGHFPLKG